MNTTPELIADYACVVGEGPLWHPDEQRVYWVDIGRGRMFRYAPATGDHEMVYEGEPIGGFTLQEDGSLLIFLSRGTVKIWRDGEMTTVIEEIAAERETRFNDVIADPLGGVFCGTMPAGDRLGCLYRLDPSGELTVVLPEVDVSNGMGFTPDRKQMYYTESMPRVIWIFDYDETTGSLSNRRPFVTPPEELGVPDGMTVDADGNVWSAFWGGSCLIRYNPDGQETLRIPFAEPKVSCVAFGGDDYADMYVTTAGGDEKATDGENAGALFRLRLGIRGVPEFRSRIGL